MLLARQHGKGFCYIRIESELKERELKAALFDCIDGRM
jgi:hypothetical protein